MSRILRSFSFLALHARALWGRCCDWARRSLPWIQVIVGWSISVAAFLAHSERIRLWLEPLLSPTNVELLKWFDDLNVADWAAILGFFFLWLGLDRFASRAVGPAAQIARQRAEPAAASDREREVGTGGAIWPIFAQHRAAILGGLFSLVVLNIAGHAFQRQEQALANGEEQIKARSALNERSLDSLASYRAGLWKLLTDCYPRAYAALQRVECAQSSPARADLDVASLATCSKVYDQVNDDYIKWTWQAGLLAGEVVSLPPCRSILAGDLLKIEATPEEQALVASACRIMKCDAPFRLVSAQYRDFVAKYRNYVATNRTPLPPQKQNSNTSRAKPTHDQIADNSHLIRQTALSKGLVDLERSTLALLEITRKMGCALAISGNRLRRAGSFVDPLGYCGDSFADLRVCSDAKNWCACAKQPPSMIANRPPVDRTEIDCAP